jgi:hypothetical protein
VPKPTPELRPPRQPTPDLMLEPTPARAVARANS